jgi:hypothetical protein
MNQSYKIVLEDLKTKFGKFTYFNDKRKSFRRIKIMTRYTNFNNEHLMKYIARNHKDRIMEIGVTDNQGSHFDGVYFKLPL